MLAVKDFHTDSYELQFEEDTPEEERRFYVQKYPNVNMVAESRVHCTTCDTHIGCAVANEATIRMHPILRVTNCKKCYAFYNTGEFSKDDDGSENFCRWCGQGGELYCCSKCPYVFCKKCIVQNLPTGKIREIEHNDSWNCFSCSPKDMWDLRAQHWALVNYIKKTKKKILRDEKHDHDKIDELMNRDPTSCCREKKDRKSRSNDAKGKRKRRDYTTSSSSGCSTPEPKRIQDHCAMLPNMVAPTVQQKTATNQLDELVCTPDVLNMFSETEDVPPVREAASKSTPLVVLISAPVAVNQTSATSEPPPLIFRQLPTSSQTVRFPNHQFSADSRAVSAVNQANASSSANLGVQSRANHANPNPDSIRFNIQSSLPPQLVQMQPTHQSLHQTHLQQQQISNGMNTGMSSGMTSGMNTGMNTGGMNNLPMIPMNIANKYPSTALGLSQSHLETEILKAQEICQYIVGKLNTLMKSNAYKSVRNYNDVKELHRHLSFLYAYMIERFKTAHEKCAKSMKVLSDCHEAANKLADKKNKYTNVDDDLEVVEPTTVCIQIDSDDENDARISIPPLVVVSTVESITKKSMQQPKTSLQPKPQDSQPESTTNVVNKVTQIEVTETIDADELDLQTSPTIEENTENDTNDGVDKTCERENDGELDDNMDDLTNGQKKDDLNRSSSPTDNSIENISSPDMFNDDATNEMHNKMDVLTNGQKSDDLNRSSSPADTSLENISSPDVSNDDATMMVHRLDNKMDDLTNGQKKDDLNSSNSPADISFENISSPDVFDDDATNEVKNELLDDLDNQQSSLPRNSVENISSPDMFDDMVKNGFDRPDINMSFFTENTDADSHLV